MIEWMHCRPADERLRDQSHEKPSGFIPGDELHEDDANRTVEMSMSGDYG